MLIKRPPDIRPSEITDKDTWKSRRTFLKGVALLGAGVGMGIGVKLSSGPGVAPPQDQSPAIPNIKPGPYGKNLTPTDYRHVTRYNNFYEYGSGKGDPVNNAAQLKTRPWSIIVDGACDKPGEIGIEDLLSGFTQEERIYRLRCVEAWAMVVPWVGFPLGDLLKRFQPNSRAKYVAFETLYDTEHMSSATMDLPYTEGLRMDEAMHPLTILATGLYGELLPKQNGAPIRLVVPWKYGFKSIKSIVRISFTEEMPTTTWTVLGPREYGFYANVNPEVQHRRWSQRQHRVIGGDLLDGKQDTLMFNGYADQVAELYRGMDLKVNF